jgi:hypothetical protein
MHCELGGDCVARPITHPCTHVQQVKRTIAAQQYATDSSLHHAAANPAGGMLTAEAPCLEVSRCAGPTEGAK